MTYSPFILFMCNNNYYIANEGRWFKVIHIMFKDRSSSFLDIGEVWNSLFI